jgi:hypothetical protein
MHIDQIFRRSLVSLSLSLALFGGVTVARAEATQILGRWTAQSQDVVSENGAFYTTVDIVACQAGMCGISVSQTGECGPQLFHVNINQTASGRLHGQGRWGKQTQEVQIDPASPDASGAGRFAFMLISQASSLSSRLGSMPGYMTVYTSAGEAACPAEHPAS